MGSICGRALPWAVPALAFVAGLGLARAPSVLPGPAPVGGAARPSPAEPLEPAGRPGRRPSVLLVTADGLVVADSGASGATATPALDRLAASGTRLVGALAASPDPSEALAAVLAGRPAHLLGEPGPPGTLAERLAAAGYATTAVGPPLAHTDASLQGFGAVVEAGEPTVEAVAAALRERAVELGGARPWLVWVHLPRPEEGARAAGVRRLDRALLEVLAALPVAADDVVAFVSIAGPAWGAAPDGLEALGLEALRVPLVLAGPADQPAGQLVRGPVSTSDLAPTLLELAGLAPGATTGSVSLVRGERVFEPAVRPVLSSAPAGDGRVWSLVLGDLRLVAAAPDRPAALHDLAADPAERRNLAAARPEQVARLRRILAASIGPGAGARPPR